MLTCMVKDHLRSIRTLDDDFNVYCYIVAIRHMISRVRDWKAVTIVVL